MSSSYLDLCADDICPQCNAPCDQVADHQGQHHCINCGCQWWSEGVSHE